MATYQVSASTDDCYKKLYNNAFYLTSASLVVGKLSDIAPQWGSGMRFTNIAIPQGATIAEAHLTLKSYGSRDGTFVNTRISAEDVDSAVTFDSATFGARWANRTTARVDWDNISAWASAHDYNSPDIKTVIQGIVNRGGWSSGNSMVIFGMILKIEVLTQKDDITHMLMRVLLHMLLS